MVVKNFNSEHFLCCGQVFNGILEMLVKMKSTERLVIYSNPGACDCNTKLVIIMMTEKNPTAAKTDFVVFNSNKL